MFDLLTRSGSTKSRQRSEQERRTLAHSRSSSSMIAKKARRSYSTDGSSGPAMNSSSYGRRGSEGNLNPADDMCFLHSTSLILSRLLSRRDRPIKAYTAFGDRELSKSRISASRSSTAQNRKSQ